MNRERLSDILGDEGGKKTPNPQTTTEGRKRWSLPVGPRLALAAAFTSGVIVGSVFTHSELGKNIGDWVGNRITQGPTEPIIPEYLKTYSGFENVIIDSLRSYESWQGFSQRSLQPLLSTRQPKEVSRMFEQMIKNTVIGSVNLMQTASLLGFISDQVRYDASANKIWINRQDYDLNNRFHLQLVNSFLHTTMKSIDVNKRVHEYNSGRGKAELVLEAEQLDEDAQVLKWFRDLNPPIIMGDESFAFFPRDQMVMMARVYKAVDEVGFKLPDKVDWCNSECIERTDKQAVGLAYLNENRTELENKADAEVFAHEVAHLISVQRNLLQKFGEIRGMKDKASEEDRLKYISEYAMTNNHEDFADTFAYYFADGDQFRLMLDQLRIHKPDEYTFMEAKYDFMKSEVFQGKEFSKNGKVRNEDLEKRRQQFAGLRWIPEEKRLEFEPNPDSWKDKKEEFFLLPVLEENDFKTLFVGFRLEGYLQFRNEKQYTVYVFHTGMNVFPKMTFFPMMGDDRVRVSSYKSTGIPLEATDRLDVDIEQTEDSLVVSFMVDSLEPVQSGQARLPLYPLTNNGRGYGLYIEPDAADAIPYYDIQKFRVLEGPVLRQGNNKARKLWKVEASFYNIPQEGRFVEKAPVQGWVEEGLIGYLDSEAKIRS